MRFIDRLVENLRKSHCISKMLLHYLAKY